MKKNKIIPFRRETGAGLWAIIAAAGLVVMIVVNALANILPINGVNTGTLSDELANLFVPAGLTFAIWGLIYLLLMGHSVSLLVDAFGKRPSGQWKVTDSRLYLVNTLANTAWIFAWHYRMVGLSLLLMLVVLGTLIALEERIYCRKTLPKTKGKVKEKTNGIASFFLTTPLAVYFGWICVATIANVTAFLVKSGWNGLGLDPRIWTVVAIAAGAAVALALIFLRSAVAAPLVVVWAYAGIIIKRTGVDADFSRAVWIAAIIGIIAIVASLGAKIGPKLVGTQRSSR